MTDTDQPNTANQGAADDLEKGSLDTVYQKLGTSPAGLTSDDAKARLEKYGRNELVDKEASDLEKFLRFFWGPIAWMIEAAAVLSLLMGHWADLTIILVLLLYNAISGFWQERKASDALAALKAGLAPKATALRDGQFTAIDAAEVVPGDVVRIKLGEISHYSPTRKTHRPADLFSSCVFSPATPSLLLMQDSTSTFIPSYDYR